MSLLKNRDRKNIEILESLKDIVSKDFGVTKKNDSLIDSFYSLNTQLNILRDLQEKVD